MCAKCYINTKSPKKHFFIKYDVNITHHQSSLIKNFSDCAKYFGWRTKMEFMGKVYSRNWRRKMPSIYSIEMLKYKEEKKEKDVHFCLSSMLPQLIKLSWDGQKAFSCIRRKVTCAYCMFFTQRKQRWGSWH